MHPRHPRVLKLAPRTLPDVAVEKLVDLRRLHVVPHVFSVPAQRTLDAENNRPVRPLGCRQRRRAVSTWLVWRAQRWIIAGMQPHARSRRPHSVVSTRGRSSDSNGAAYSTTWALEIVRRETKCECTPCGAGDDGRCGPCVYKRLA